jgi:hypothetical protein
MEVFMEHIYSGKLLEQKILSNFFHPSSIIVDPTGSTCEMLVKYSGVSVFRPSFWLNQNLPSNTLAYWESLQFQSPVDSRIVVVMSPVLHKGMERFRDLCKYIGVYADHAILILSHKDVELMEETVNCGNPVLKLFKEPDEIELIGNEEHDNLAPEDKPYGWFLYNLAQKRHLLVDEPLLK